MALGGRIAYVEAMTQPHRPVGPGDHVFLIDGSSFVFRAYYQSIRQDQKYNYRMDRLPNGAIGYSRPKCCSSSATGREVSSRPISP